MRNIEVPLERLLDIVTSLQFDGLDQVHDFLGELVETLPDHELHEYIKSLQADGYDHNDRDEADQHLRRWRARYVKPPTKKSGPGPVEHVQTTVVLTETDYGEGYET